MEQCISTNDNERNQGDSNYKLASRSCCISLANVTQHGTVISKLLRPERSSMLMLFFPKACVITNFRLNNLHIHTGYLHLLGQNMTNPNMTAFTFTVNVLSTTAVMVLELETMDWSLTMRYSLQPEKLEIFVLYFNSF